MRKTFDPGLVEAVREYFRWNGDRSAHPVRFEKDANDFEMLLVRFTDDQGVRMSGLMMCQPWADGHWDVTEVESVTRENEAEMLEEFRSDQPIWDEDPWLYEPEEAN